MVVVLIFMLMAYYVEGVRLAIFCMVALVLLGMLGMWEQAMDTLGQVIVAALLSVLIGIPLGSLSARSNTLEQLIKPTLDFLQTIPVRLSGAGDYAVRRWARAGHHCVGLVCVAPCGALDQLRHPPSG
jgi:ABC-type Fe3+ transport system permease subunit